MLLIAGLAELPSHMSSPTKNLPANPWKIIIRHILMDPNTHKPLSTTQTIPKPIADKPCQTDPNILPANHNQTHHWQTTPTHIIAGNQNHSRH